MTASATSLAGPLARLVLGRLGQALATAALLATLCFAFVHALPGDLALRVAAARVGDERVTTQTADRIRRSEGLDRPLVFQYLHWMATLARGDLGRSLVTGQPVAGELARHGAFTLRLGLAGWLLSYAIALPLGIAAGLRPGRWLDRATTALAVTLASLPSFLVGLGLVSLFALTLRWLPPAGFGTTAHMVLPALTLALSLVALSIPVIRNAVVEVRSAFYMTYARVRGLSAAAALRHHGLRNAAIPVVTFAALQFAYVMDGFVVIETLFNYPGMGELLVTALIARDVPVIVGAGLTLGFAFALVSLAADLARVWLDPRRLREGRP
ncbi:ABC transporter permease [uncultured Alsobacter sp.]|uniref:ABC transporter permease n=1 Tax=uncultured Alsobacter sp. TaxID=1748258 RepID=UPI0025E484D4|nr:ABC transporter permease [uncultured Alsobacter sp.]